MKKIFSVMAALILLAGCSGGSAKNEGTINSSTETSMIMAQGQESASPNVLAGMEALRQGNVKEAIGKFDDAIRQNPKDLQAYLLLGQTYMHLKDYNHAISTFMVASRVAPTNGQVHYLLAANFGLAGNYKMAEMEAQKSLAIFRQHKDEANFKRTVAFLQGLPSNPANKQQ